MSSWEEKRAHQLARLDRMQLDIEETADPDAPDTIRRLHRIQELRDLSLALTPQEWAASKDVPDNIPWSPTPPPTS
ncbi:MAG TPA: hypothetical protein VL595_26305 [Pseudonocardia sp.]|nr:hypothetical protein [Pseudonocardia sp.]